MCPPWLEGNQPGWTLYAVPFYEAMGYKKTTGIRNCWSFDGRGLKYQPMKKIIGLANQLL